MAFFLYDIYHVPIFYLNDISIFLFSNKTALFIATENKNLEMIKYLLSCENIDINIKMCTHYIWNWEYKTIFKIAFDTRQIEIIKCLLSYVNLEHAAKYILFKLFHYILLFYLNEIL